MKPKKPRRNGLQCFDKGKDCKGKMQLARSFPLGKPIPERRGKTFVVDIYVCSVCGVDAQDYRYA